MTVSPHQYMFWGTIGLHIICVFVMTLIMLFYMVHYICYTKKTSRIRFIIKLFSCIGSIACISCSVFSAFTVYIDKDHHDYKTIWYQGQNISHLVIDICTYSIYIYRLHLSFFDTAFKISSCWL
eukprot:493988_1